VFDRPLGDRVPVRMSDQQGNGSGRMVSYPLDQIVAHVAPPAIMEWRQGYLVFRACVLSISPLHSGLKPSGTLGGLPLFAAESGGELLRSEQGDQEGGKEDLGIIVLAQSVMNLVKERRVRRGIRVR